MKPKPSRVWAHFLRLKGKEIHNFLFYDYPEVWIFPLLALIMALMMGGMYFLGMWVSHVFSLGGDKISFFDLGFFVCLILACLVFLALWTVKAVRWLRRNWQEATLRATLEQEET